MKMIQITGILEAEKYLDGVTAVVFDLDDTLYSEKDYVKSGYACIARAFPQIADMEKKLWSAFLAKKPAIDVVLNAEGITDDAEKARCLQLYRFHIPDIQLFPGVADMLQRLRNKGMKLGIITDGRPEGQWAKITALGLQAYVDEIIVTDELGGIEFRKPNTAAFERMCEKLGESFEQMVYIGDNSKKDFVAPEKLGMRAIHFLNPDGLYV